MGGLLSAGLAVLDAMYKENRLAEMWKQNLFDTKWVRFRDDIFGIAPEQLKDRNVHQIQQRFQKIYGKHLEVVIENVSYSNSTFLDYNVVFLNNKIITWEHNKNIQLAKQVSTRTLPVIRYPHYTAELTKKVFIGFMIGGLKHLLKLCNSEFSIAISVLQKLFEWLQLHYPKTWLIRAIFLSGIPDPKSYKSIVKLYPSSH